jgi:predicted component of type VI protein secretion system
MPTAPVTPEAQTIDRLREALQGLLRAAAPTLPLVERYDRVHAVTLHDALDTAFGVLAMDAAQHLARVSAELLARALVGLEAQNQATRHPGGTP